MSLREQVRFVAGFYRERAVMRYGAHLRRDPLCRLHLESSGRRNPYPIYDEVRRRGPLIRSVAGAWTSASYPICEQVLRDRRSAWRCAPPINGPDRPSCRSWSSIHPTTRGCDGS